MLVDGIDCRLKKLSHVALTEPYGLVLMKYLEACFAVATLMCGLLPNRLYCGQAQAELRQRRCSTVLRSYRDERRFDTCGSAAR